MTTEVVFHHLGSGNTQTIRLPNIPRVGDRVLLPDKAGVYVSYPVSMVRWQPKWPSRRSGVLGEWMVEIILGDPS